mmetsp:Transcript_80071/g.138981  ORF Transcript_80071/g.138981 Transcript_80071/m.138981 type:complete len:344 (+) Transcript_80071:72-1103(+)
MPPKQGPGARADEEAAFINQVSRSRGGDVEMQADELGALMKQSREEQAVISSKILALKGGGAAGGAGAWAPGVGGTEVVALREQLAEVDSRLIEREAEIENLRAQVKRFTMQNVEEPKMGAVWRSRYEDAQKRVEALERNFRETQSESQTRADEIKNMNKYVRIVEADIRVRDGQRERLIEETSRTQEKVRTLEVERKSLESQLRRLEEGFLRCVGRVTQSLASGVATVVVNEKSAEARFVVLRVGPGGEGVIEIFKEPDAYEELVAMDLSISGGASCTPDRESMTLHLAGSTGSGQLRLCCVSMEEFMKWSGALRLVGFDLNRATASPFTGGKKNAGGRFDE